MPLTVADDARNESLIMPLSAVHVVLDTFLTEHDFCITLYVSSSVGIRAGKRDIPSHLKDR